MVCVGSADRLGKCTSIYEPNPCVHFELTKVFASSVRFVSTAPHTKCCWVLLGFCFVFLKRGNPTNEKRPLFPVFHIIWELEPIYQRAMCTLHPSPLGIISLYNIYFVKGRTLSAAFSNDA